MLEWGATSKKGQGSWGHGAATVERFAAHALVGSGTIDDNLIPPVALAVSGLRWLATHRNRRN
jgi:hypothetical protein